MKILIISDTHGDISRLKDVYLKHQDCDYFFHLGDFELPSYLISPFSYVIGNCDYLEVEPKVLDLTINDIKIHLEHGNRINYSYFEKYIKNLNVDIFLFGHLHKQLAFKIDKTLVLNPGSLNRPRDDSKGCYLILNIKNKNDITYKFYEYNDD